MDINLKPCPLCGKKAVLAVDNGFRVLCSGCGAQTERIFYKTADVTDMNCAAWHAIDAWNRRADDGQD
jgi:ribosomal protein S27AE